MNANITDVGEIFARDVQDHKMTILHEDGLYRHVRFQRPETGINHFDLVTWPGHLSLSGDRDGFTFARMPDMFQFFCASSGWNLNSINPQYWAEKLTTRVPVKVYSEAKFRQLVAEDAETYSTDIPGLAQAIQDQILGEDGYYNLENEHEAHEALRDFKYDYESGLDKDGKPKLERFHFADAWEWDFADWDFHYLYACHAIQWGIDRYNDRTARSEQLIGALTA